MERLVRQPDSRRFLLAVSGGADSAVMAHLFRRAGYNFTIAHCNFHLRGKDSDNDMQLVEKMAENWKIPLIIKEFDTLGIQKNSGRSIEMTARDLRYDWFREAGRDFDCIATAHQANDAAETMLLNLCRGTGLHGLTSIPERNGKIIRPMLTFTAEEIRRYAHEHDIPYAVDRTNADERYRRNRIRGSVIPLLETLNPNLIRTLAKDRQVFCLQWAFLRDAVDSCRKTMLKREKDHCSIDMTALRQHHFPSLILYELLREFGFNADAAGRIADCGPRQTGREFLSPGYRLLVDRGQYLIYPADARQENEKTFGSLDELSEEFRIELSGPGDGAVFPKDSRSLFIPCDKLRFPVTMRTWRHGDFFYPIGGKGRRKLSDFFIDHKINKIQKERIPLLCIGGDIVWIVGLRSDERYKVCRRTSRYYKITRNEHL